MFTAMHVQIGTGWSTSKATLSLAEHEVREYVLRLKSFVPLSELLTPRIWAECKGLRQNDLIRIIMPDPRGGREFDFKLVCVRALGPTILMALWPHLPSMTDAIPTKEAEANGLPRLEHARAS